MTEALADEDGSKAPAAGEPLVIARALSKTYGEGDSARTVLEGVDLEIRAGSLTAVVGPSGSGKSTLLLCLAGLERSSSGSITMLGDDLARRRPGRTSRVYRRSVGFVFQEYNLIPYLSARQNAALPGLLDHRRDALARADEALDALEMRAHSRTLASRLSGGQQQRAALARVLAGSPEIVFADEPTGALDSVSSSVVLSELRGLAQRGAAVVLVTHDLDAAALADRVLVLHDGRIAADVGTEAGSEQISPVKLAGLMEAMGR